MGAPRRRCSEGYFKGSFDPRICPSTSSGRTVITLSSVRGELRPKVESLDVIGPVEPHFGITPVLHHRRLIPTVLLALFAVLLAACSSGSTAPRDLLLGPEDFPGQEVTETSRENGETSQFEPAVQVELNSPDFTMLESLVLFDSNHLALTILGGIKQDQIAQGVTAQPVEGFEDNSGVLVEQLHGQPASTLFFVEGRALVRITLSGSAQAERVWEIARLAREKSGT